MMVSRRVRAVLLVLAALAILVVGMQFGTGYDEPRIVITNDGFEPSEISIPPGTLVTFVNRSERESWPASNPHPTHTEHPLFDVQKPLKPGAEWAVRFEEAGEYRFHDHIAESEHGVVHVGASFLSWIASFIPQNCSDVADAEKTACMERALRETIERDGLASAFELFLHYYRTEPLFVEGSCHWHSHLLGEEAYELYAKGETLELVPEVSYCGYGFFHGFMARLVSENPDYTEAKRFCETATKDVSREAPSARINCFHGIGHGFIEDPVPEEYWGKPRELWSRAFPVCDTISDVASEREECIEGAFNGVVQLMEQQRFELSLDYSDIFKWCRMEPHEYQRGCYYEFAQKLDRVLDYSAANLTSILRDVPQEFRKMITWVAVAGIMQSKIAESSHLSIYAECTALADGIRSACIEGILGGYRAHGEPGTSHERALALCSDPTVQPSDVAPCYAFTVKTFSTLYNAEKMKSLCSAIPAPHVPSGCDRFR